MYAREALLAAYENTRRMTERLCSPLTTEDYVIQAVSDVSPPKWHLAHTAWFFERVILQEYQPGYRPHDERYYYIFNSYYQSLGERADRHLRGTFSRPTVRDIETYRRVVDERMLSLASKADAGLFEKIAPLIELGIHHEQQHQELLVTDIKYNFAVNPLRPAYLPLSLKDRPTPVRAGFFPVEGGLVQIGAHGGEFCWDNELPSHKSYLEDFEIMNRLVTCDEYLGFMQEGGYSNPLLWLSDGWDIVVSREWKAPLFWERREETWEVMTLNGLLPVSPAEPVGHLSFFEADAYARWVGARLPTEEEWEHAARTVSEASGSANFLEDGAFHPQPACADSPESHGLHQMLGDLWEWTGSPYRPYPGYRQEAGPLGEYNGKFMNGQMVLRGGSCATPRSHIRTTYRNFFQPDKRWQFTGVRLARDAHA